MAQNYSHSFETLGAPFSVFARLGFKVCLSVVIKDRARAGELHTSHLWSSHLLLAIDLLFMANNLSLFLRFATTIETWKDVTSMTKVASLIRDLLTSSFVISPPLLCYTHADTHGKHVTCDVIIYAYVHTTYEHMRECVCVCLQMWFLTMTLLTRCQPFSMPCHLLSRFRIRKKTFILCVEAVTMTPSTYKRCPDMKKEERSILECTWPAPAMT